MDATRETGRQTAREQLSPHSARSFATMRGSTARSRSEKAEPCACSAAARDRVPGLRRVCRGPAGTGGWTGPGLVLGRRRLPVVQRARRLVRHRRQNGSPTVMRPRYGELREPPIDARTKLPCRDSPGGPVKPDPPARRAACSWNGIEPTHDGQGGHGTTVRDLRWRPSEAGRSGRPALAVPGHLPERELVSA